MTENAASKLSRTLTVIAVVAWAILLVVVCARAVHTPHKNSVMTTYLAAGSHWLAGEDLYIGGRGFVYSPLTAAFFAPFATLPSGVANTLWRLLNAAAFLGGMALWLRAGFHGIARRHDPVVFLLLLPLAIGNFNNGQVNPLVTGLLLTALTTADCGRFTLAAFCVAGATFLKIYPLAIGLLLVLLYPKKFAWRLLLALAVLAELSLLLQKPEYVLDQYRLWWATRAADNRLVYDANIAPRDLWLLCRLAHIPISQSAYMVVQLLTAAGVGAVCAYGRWRNWPRERLAVAALSLGCSWMLLCGPASESATYILLAPAVVLALVDAWFAPVPASPVMRGLIAGSYAILIIGLGINSFLHLKKTAAVMSVQPVAAVLFAGYSVGNLRSCKRDASGAPR